MKEYTIFFFVFIVAISTAVNITNSNKTSSNGNELIGNNIDDDESFYIIDMLLVADGVSIPKVGQNDTGLSIRLTARDGTLSPWHRLYTNEELNNFGQRTYILPSTTHNLGIISNISIRIDKAELAVSSMPYYLCIHGTINNSTVNEKWSGCTYMQPFVGNKNGSEQQYPLRDVNGKLI